MRLGRQRYSQTDFVPARDSQLEQVVAVKLQFDGMEQRFRSDIRYPLRGLSQSASCCTSASRVAYLALMQDAEKLLPTSDAATRVSV